jgi:hypothetical protein
MEPPSTYPLTVSARVLQWVESADLSLVVINGRSWPEAAYRFTVE